MIISHQRREIYLVTRFINILEPTIGVQGTPWQERKQQVARGG